MNDTVKVPPEAQDAWCDYDPPEFKHESSRLRHAFLSGWLASRDPEAAKLEDALEWFGGNTRLSLEHYSPVYCDDPDEAVEWRVIEQRGNINDREYLTVGRGETPLSAILDARTRIDAALGAANTPEQQTR